MGSKLFEIVNGHRYRGAFPIFIVLALGAWFSLMFSPTVNILISQKAFKFLFTLSVVAFLLNFVGNLYLIPILGGVGAAIATIMSNFLINLSATLYVLTRKFSMSFE